MDPLRFVYFAVSCNLALWTAPMGKEMIGTDLTYGIWWVVVISWHIIRRLRPKPLCGIIDIEFKEIRR